jgi:hypothetical protein
MTIVRYDPDTVSPGDCFSTLPERVLCWGDEADRENGAWGGGMALLL